MRRRRSLTRSLPWYALAALITVTLYWNFDAHVEAHGEPGVDLMARQEIARITERVRMLEDLGVSGLRSLRTKTERDPEKEQASVRAAPYAWCIRAGNNTGNRFARI